ncbi:DUF1963 domain-containing protein [Actinosynnema sp. NPDC050436]|uniref:DUF1963 domain-containing protein n=1 Tax=Actinosynnema sp. NPDC050436 TaxID=3155659 RepID=UPI0033F08EDE
MDVYERFRRAAADRGIPADEVEKFIDQLRFEILLGSTEPGEEVVGQNGGLPRLPVGAQWPSSGSGLPLPFIASVDCAVLPRAEGLPLPEDGSLLFFLHHEEDYPVPLGVDGPEYARAVYVPAGTETEVASPPPGHDEEGFFHESIPFLAPEFTLSASVVPALPPWIEERDEFEFDDSEVLERLFEELEHVDELCELVDELWPEERCSTLSLGGYCDHAGQGDSPVAELADAGFTSRPETRAALPAAEQFHSGEVEEYLLSREWVPLIQFSTRSENYYGCFLIDLEDLAAKQFDRMRSVTRFFK